MARPDATIGTAELADVLRVHRNTVLNWIRSGIIRPDRRTLGGGYARFKRSTVRAIERKLRSSSRAAA